MTDKPLREVRANGEAEEQGKDAVTVDSEKGDAAHVGTDDDETYSPKPLSRLQAILLASSVMLTYCMMAVAVASGLIIIPAMSTWFQVSELATQWVASSYTLAYACGLLVSGRFADLYGRKLLFIGGLCLGLVANIVSGFVPNRIGLCVMRAFAGLGLAMASPAGFGIIGVNFTTEPARTMAFAALGVGTPFGASMGQILGGVVATSGGRSWRYIYFIIAGINLIPIITGLISIPSDRSRKREENRQVDWLGAGLITVGLSLLLFAVTQAGMESDGWRTPYIPTVFAVSIVLILAFGYWEYYAESRTSIPPIVKLSIFTRYRWMITAMLAIAFLAWCGCCGWVYLTSIYYQKLLGQSPLENALHILPGPITGILSSGLVALLAPRVPAPILLALGGISTGFSNALFAIQDPHTLYWKCEFFAAILTPLGGDLTIPIGSIIISNLCSHDEQSVAGALFQVSLQIAGTVDICFSSLIQVQREKAVGLLPALRESLWFNTGLCWGVLPIIFLFMRRVGLAKDVAKVI